MAHQRDVGLDAREWLIDTLARRTDQVALVTCHRVEIYEMAEEVATPAGMRTLLDAEAARHLFRVASGLDSMLAGEPQILGQIRSAYESAHAPHQLLRRAFERALHVGRAVRRGTRLGAVRSSVGSLAVDTAVRALEDPASATVLVVGAGEMGKLAVRALARRVGRTIIANRDRAKADALAREHGAVAWDLEDLPAAVANADALISAADTRGAHLTRAALEPRAERGRFLVIDIAVPRSVAEDARALAGVDYRSVDDLAADAASVSEADLAVADEMCLREAESLMREWNERGAVGAIHDVRAHADSLRREQLARAMRRLGHLDERDRQIVEALSIGVMNSLLHAPTVAMRERPSRADTARELFGLEKPR
ncbi:MAG TPA: glutamyl-tRNA reductase [Candidatus Limnocylindria bacterium]|nr:glutamyl-tRNA reductase [Candidatus Limnocylindria bacterium]